MEVEYGLIQMQLNILAQLRQLLKKKKDIKRRKERYNQSKLVIVF